MTREHQCVTTAMGGRGRRPAAVPPPAPRQRGRRSHVDRRSSTLSAATSLDEAELGAYVAERRPSNRCSTRPGRRSASSLGLAADDVAFVESASAGRDGPPRRVAVRRRATRWPSPRASGGPTSPPSHHRGLSVRQLAVDRRRRHRPRRARRDAPRRSAGARARHARRLAPAARPTARRRRRALAAPPACRCGSTPPRRSATSTRLLRCRRRVRHESQVAQRPAWRRCRRRRRAPLVGAADAAVWSPCRADAPAVRHLESHEANVAGRVGFAAAVGEHVTLGPAARAPAPRRGRSSDAPGARRRDRVGGRRRSRRSGGHHGGATDRRRRRDGGPRSTPRRASDRHDRGGHRPSAARDDRTAAARQPARRRHGRRPGPPARVGGVAQSRADRRGNRSSKDRDKDLAAHPASRSCGSRRRS